MGPDLLKSGPDQFFLTVYTDNNQVRLMTEKSPNAHCLHCWLSVSGPDFYLSLRYLSLSLSGKYTKGCAKERNMAAIMAATLLPFPFRRRVTPFSGENSAETLNRFRRKRRRKIFKWSILLMAIIMSQCTIERTIWQLPRTGAWFQLALNEFSDQEWYENFRLSRATFRFLVEELKPELTFASCTLPGHPTTISRNR